MSTLELDLGSVEGPAGVRGSLWFKGTGITGTSTTGTIFTGSGVSSALVGDYFINVATDSNLGNVYYCTVEGPAAVSKWVYSGNLKGPTGPQGPDGTTGSTGSQGQVGATGVRGSMWFSGTGITGTLTDGTIFTGSGISSALAGDWYINIANGNLYYCTTAGNAAAAKWVYKGCIKGPAGGIGPQGPEGKPGSNIASVISYTDTYSIGKTTMQAATDYLVDQVINKLMSRGALVNNGLCTEAGFAADARQLNPNIEGTLAAIVAKVNSDLTAHETIFDNTVIGVRCEAIREGKSIRVHWSGFINTNLIEGANDHHMWGTIPKKYCPSHDITANVLTSTTRLTIQLSIKTTGTVSLGWVYSNVIPAQTDQLYQYLTWSI